MSKCICIVVLLVAMATAQDADSSDQIVGGPLLISTNINDVIPFQPNNQLPLLNVRPPPSVAICPPPRPASLDGTYTTNFPQNPKIRIKFSGNQVSILNGCNTFSGQFETHSTECIKFGQLTGTKKGCANNFDSLYTTALKNSAFYSIEGNRVILKNSKRKVIIILTLVQNQPKEVKFDGFYRPSLTDDKDLLVKFEPNGKVRIVNGCNDQSATYRATNDGKISFSGFQSTKKYCQDDKDSIYTDALVNSVRFESRIIAYERVMIIRLLSNSGHITLELTDLGKVPPAPIAPTPTPTPSGCKANEVLTPKGCWTSCAHFDFSHCPKAYGYHYRPANCAYTKDGQYVSHNSAC
jgi:heat shock protein HslJ